MPVLLRTPIFAACLLCLGGIAKADTTPVGELSLEDLMQVEVTSVSKKPQRLAHVAASIFVITAEDIRLSGANSIPEALRLAPGVDATRVSGNRWAVSIRGFSDRLANKLQVLVDGRSVFNPAFSGVLWEQLQFPMEDIERIEVIRGPGATVWGSNAVNGVVNIITRSAAATQGVQAVAGGGTVDGAYGRARFGGSNLDQDLYYRAYGAVQNGSMQRAPYGAGADDWKNRSAGFRIDGYAAGGSRWDVSADFAEGHGESRTILVNPGATLSGRVPEDHSSVALRGRVEQKLDDGANVQLQATLSKNDYRVAGLANDQRTTFDIGLQHRLAVGTRHDVVWGGEFRVSSDTLVSSDLMVADEPSRTLSYYSLFGQDEILMTDALRLTLGLRMDHSPFTGWASQPTARLSWNLKPTQTLWAAASRAVRAPSRSESGLTLTYLGGVQTVPGIGPVPLVYHVRSNGSFQNEVLQAYELGLRSQWAPTLSTDITVFSHQYNNLRTPGTPDISYLGLPFAINVTSPIANGGALTLNGVEMSGDWRPLKDWRFQLAHTYNDVGSLDAGQALATSLVLPENITSARASWAPTSRTSVDFWWRYTSARSSPGNTLLVRNAYSSIDMRLGWKPRKDLELSLIGQNLNDGACQAIEGLALAAEVTGTVLTCMPRTLNVQARLDF